MRHLYCLCTLLVLVQPSLAFLPRVSLSKPHTFVPPLKAGDSFETSAVSSDTIVNGESSFGGLVTLGDAKSQLFSAFAALKEEDKYDAVLTGLCAKILDQTNVTASDAASAIQDPLQLMQEMNQKRIRAGPRSLMALVDSSIKTNDAKIVAKVMSLARKNAGIDTYGSLQTDVELLPSSPNTKVKCADGSFKTRKERLDSLEDIPSDDRAKEVSGALAVAAVAGACLFTDVSSMNDVTPFTNLLLGSMLTVGAIDNFYDIIKTGSSMAMNQIQKDKKSDESKFSLPEKDSLPLGLGTGQFTGTVVRGMTRLLTVDAERESQCEAAALFAAYSLGLPCFAFRPNALEGSVLVVESTRNDNELDSLDSSAGILRMLVWLLAPVAMENMKHSQLIMSDPREAEGFLERLEEYAQRKDGSLNLWWLGDMQERQDLLKWAFAEADLLLRENRATVNEVAQCLMGGAATVGDCVAIMERW